MKGGGKTARMPLKNRHVCIDRVDLLQGREITDVVLESLKNSEKIKVTKNKRKSQKKVLYKI